MRNTFIYLIVLLLLSLGCKKEVLYTLNVTVTPSGSGTTSITSGTYQAGQTVSITATPAPEYIFKGWSGSITSDNNPVSILVDTSKTLVAYFEKRQYPLSLTIEGSGVVKEEIVLTQSKVGSYPSGTIVKLTAIADTGWKFDSWSGDTSLTVNPITINFKKSYSIKAKFVEEPIKFTTNLDTGLYYLEDILPLKIVISSAVPKTGLALSIETLLKDSNKVIFKKDTSLAGNSTLALNIPGHKMIGTYTLKIKVSSKVNSTNTTSKSIDFAKIPILPTVNRKIFPNINWNSVTQGRSSVYDFNLDKTPDIISSEFNTSSAKLTPIFYISDFSGKELYSFDLKQYKQNVRDSLNSIWYDFEDFNFDGKVDLTLSYMGEWWTDGKVTFTGINTFIFINKGNMQFDIIEIIDDPNDIQFGITLFDWDFDGKTDLLTNAMQEGKYYKNIGNNKFEKRNINPLFISKMYVKGVDFDGDQKSDYINLWVNMRDEFGNYMSKDFSQILSVVTTKGSTNYSVIGKTIDNYLFITNNTTSAERINMIDGDGDGDLDLVVGSIQKTNNDISFIQEYFENNGSSFTYKPNYIEIDKSLFGELQVWKKDIDNDGLEDLYYPTYNDSDKETGKIFWWKNTKSGFKIMKTFRLKY